MTLEKGDIIAVVGTSGAGKSTLLKIIGGIEVPTKGEYYFNDTCFSDTYIAYSSCENV